MRIRKRIINIDSLTTDELELVTKVSDALAHPARLELYRYIMTENRHMNKVCTKNLVAAFEPDDDLGRVQRHVRGHDSENFLAQHSEQVGLAAHSTFVGKQDLQTFARDRCSGLVAAEKP